MLNAPQEIILDMASRARGKRLSLNLTQVGLAQRSGVSLGTIKQFERTGKISLESLVKIAIALGSASELDQLFSQPELNTTRTIDELLKEANATKQRKRGRVT